MLDAVRLCLAGGAAGDGFYVCNAILQGAQLLYADLDGNSHKLWELHSGQTYLRALPSPDGKLLAIDATSKNSNLWALEGFSTRRQWGHTTTDWP